MIERTQAFKIGDKTFASLADAQVWALADLLFKADEKPDVNITCRRIVDNAEKAIDILSTTPKSKVRARKLNGGTKKRTAKPDTAANLALK